ncbi:hypothetical protein ACIQX0_00160 [Methylobacterium sp. NPDC097213]
MLDEYRGASAGGSRARFLFANLQQRLFSSIAAFDRTLTTHRKTLLRRRDADANGTESELLDDDDAIDAATESARTELGDIDGAIAHVDRMLAVSGKARDLPDARVAALIDWIEAEMLEPGARAWQERRLILFTEWDDTRRWLVERLKEGLLARSRGKIDLNRRILVFTGQTSLEERDRIKIAFNTPFTRGVRSSLGPRRGHGFLPTAAPAATAASIPVVRARKSRLLGLEAEVDDCLHLVAVEPPVRHLLVVALQGEAQRRPRRGLHLGDPTKAGPTNSPG